jgi:hypothetical protein
MIDKIVFSEELKDLADWFSKQVSDSMKARLYLILSSELSTDEFKQAIIWAYKNCKFFPTPAELINSVQGTLDDRALLDWTKITVDANLLSPVGRKALQSIGGSSTVRMSENPSFLKKDFCAAFKAFAVNAAPDELRSPQLAAEKPRSIDDLRRLMGTENMAIVRESA